MSDATSTPPEPTSMLNRVVVVLTPFFALLAGSIAAWIGDHVPGVKLDSTQLTALIVAVITAVLTMALKWLHGWQQHEAALRSRHATVSRSGAPVPSRPSARTRQPASR
jgi:predicted anti-sigma-YlaC factor YlaD